MKHQRSAQVRSVSEDGRNFSALAVRYNVVDDYNTIFDPGCFTASVESRMPTITWGHDWQEPIGRITSYEDTPEGLILHGRFSDPEAVPRARQAMAQIRDGDIDDVSVGFSIEGDDETAKDNEGRVHFKRATLNELACVLRGAVPGAKVLAVRSKPGAVVDAKLASDAFAELASGQITLLEALKRIEDNAVAEAPKEDEKESDEDDSTDEGSESDEDESDDGEGDDKDADEKDKEEAEPKDLDLDGLDEVLQEASARV